VVAVKTLKINAAMVTVVAATPQTRFNYSPTM
jgi:hypothetical protein